MADLEDVAVQFMREHGRRLRVATKYMNLTRRFFAAHGVAGYRIVESVGATEATPAAGTAELIVDIATTGTTLRANGLKIVHTLLETNTKLIANKAAMQDPVKKRKIQHLALLLRGALAAENMVGLKMNVPAASFDEVVGLLPSLTSPTVARLHDTAWFSVEIIVRESVVRELVPRLIEKGADGIIEYPLNKVVNRSDTL
jgi:ATP phosphoribosyltransferase